MKKLFKALCLAAIFVLPLVGCNDNPDPEEITILIDDAVNCFAELELDEGIAKIEQAYKSEKNDTTKMYYALSRLALISTNEDTVKFMKETCGFESYPNKLNALIDTAWWEDCLKDDFVEKVVKANSNGLNGALDKLVNIFKSTYNEVVEISKGMSQASVLLPAVLIDALELEDFFGTSDIRVGKAELDVIIAAMGITKGLFEYVSAFDWTFKTSTISSDMDIDDFITAVQSGTELLTTQNAQRLAESKKSFIDAVDMAISSYEYITYSSKVYPAEVQDVLGEYSILSKAAKEFKKALETDGTFYVPDTNIFELKEWPTSGNDYLVKIDCGKMFSSGVLDEAIEKDSSGKVNFYTDYYWSYSYSNVSGSSPENMEPLLLSESFSSVHEKTVNEMQAEIRSKVSGDATFYGWDCYTILIIKVRLPDFITIKGIKDDDRELFYPIWIESYDNYDYE